jgi:hypothetical protein
MKQYYKKDYCPTTPGTRIQTTKRAARMAKLQYSTKGGVGTVPLSTQKKRVHKNFDTIASDGTMNLKDTGEYIETPIVLESETE